MVDILVITAHPDDELTVSGVLLKAKREGLRTALICLTKGESGGFATKEERVSEFNGATNALGLDAAWILDFPDAGLEVETAAVETLIRSGSVRRERSSLYTRMITTPIIVRSTPWSTGRCL